MSGFQVGPGNSLTRFEQHAHGDIALAAGRGHKAPEHRSQGLLVSEQLAHIVIVVQQPIQELLQLLPIVDDDPTAVVRGCLAHGHSPATGSYGDHDSSVMPPPGLPRSILVTAVSFNTPNDSLRVVKSSTMLEAQTSRAPATWP